MSSLVCTSKQTLSLMPLLPACSNWLLLPSLLTISMDTELLNNQKCTLKVKTEFTESSSSSHLLQYNHWPGFEVPNVFIRWVCGFSGIRSKSTRVSCNQTNVISGYPLQPILSFLLRILKFWTQNKLFHIPLPLKCAEAWFAFLF